MVVHDMRVVGGCAAGFPAVWNLAIGSPIVVRDALNALKVLDVRRIEGYIRLA